MSEWIEIEGRSKYLGGNSLYLRVDEDQVIVELGDEGVRVSKQDLLDALEPLR